MRRVSAFRFLFALNAYRFRRIQSKKPMLLPRSAPCIHAARSEGAHPKPQEHFGHQKALNRQHRLLALADLGCPNEAFSACTHARCGFMQNGPARGKRHATLHCVSLRSVLRTGCVRQSPISVIPLCVSIRIHSYDTPSSRIR